VCDDRGGIDKVWCVVAVGVVVDWLLAERMLDSKRVIIDGGGRKRSSRRRRLYGFEDGMKVAVIKARFGRRYSEGADAPLLCRRSIKDNDLADANGRRERITIGPLGVDRIRIGRRIIRIGRRIIRNDDYFGAARWTAARWTAERRRRRCIGTGRCCVDVARGGGGGDGGPVNVRGRRVST
jgi:hypothetical protein